MVQNVDVRVFTEMILKNKFVSKHLSKERRKSLREKILHSFPRKISNIDKYKTKIKEIINEYTDNFNFVIKPMIRNTVFYTLIAKFKRLQKGTIKLVKRKKTKNNIEYINMNSPLDLKDSTDFSNDSKNTKEPTEKDENQRFVGLQDSIILRKRNLKKRYRKV